MYPVIRAAKEMIVNRNAPSIPILGMHVSWHRCWPQDIDVFLEMNNGRIMTVLDFGRTVLAQRVGLMKAMRQNKWAIRQPGAPRSLLEYNGAAGFRCPFSGSMSRKGNPRRRLACAGKPRRGQSRGR